MILYDLDLGAIILWIIYGGVIIIFFLYAVMWIETLKINVFFFESRFIYYFSFYIYVYVIFFYNITDLECLMVSEYRYNIVMYFELLNFDIYEELEMLGNGFFFFSLLFFFFSTIVLVLTCFIVVVLVIMLKKLKYVSFINFFFRQSDYFKCILLRNQHFYIQEYDNSYLKNSTNKIFKVSVKFHRNKLHYRRI